MEIHQLRYLDAVARCGSLKAAAATCHVSQPALSVQIRKLEEEIGSPLVLRSHQGATLTPAGTRTLATARRILRELDHLRADARRRSFRARPVVRVSVQPYLASELLPLLGAQTDARTAGMPRLQIRERTHARVVESVAAGSSDVGFLDIHSVPAGEFETEELARVPFACFVPAAHPLAERSQVRLAELLDTPFFLYEHTPTLGQRLHALARQRKRSPEAPFTSEMALTVFEFVAAGAGAAVLPTTFAARAKRRHVRVVPLADYSEEIVVGALWRADTPLAAPSRELIEELRRLLQKWRPLRTR